MVFLFWGAVLALALISMVGQRRSARYWESGNRAESLRWARVTVVTTLTVFGACAVHALSTDEITTTAFAAMYALFLVLDVAILIGRSKGDPP